MFDADELSVEPIREDQQYGGVRVKTKAFLGKTRIPVQVDIGFGDAITPAAQELEFPPLLAPEGPRLKAYHLESSPWPRMRLKVVYEDRPRVKRTRNEDGMIHGDR